MSVHPSFCKRLVFRSEETGKHIVMYGKVEREDDLFIYFRTANKSYQIQRGLILTLEDSNRVFGEVRQVF